MQISASCTTSWDDGHPLDQRVAELLAKYGLQGTFYVPIENSRELLTPSQIHRLSAAFEVGAHTTHHVVLTDVSEETAESEIRESKKRLEDITGSSCDGFCFPSGRFRRRHLDMVRRAGFHFARSVELLSIRPPTRRAGVYLIPTTVQASLQSWTTYAKNSGKRLAVGNLVNAVLHARSRDWVATAHSMMQLVAKRGGVFHLWGHSWEIEREQQWPQLESVLREMRELRTKMPSVPNSGLIRADPVPFTGTAGASCDT